MSWGDEVHASRTQNGGHRTSKINSRLGPSESGENESNTGLAHVLIASAVLTGVLLAHNGRERRRGSSPLSKVTDALTSLFRKKGQKAQASRAAASSDWKTKSPSTMAVAAALARAQRESDEGTPTTEVAADVSSSSGTTKAKKKSRKKKKKGKGKR